MLYLRSFSFPTADAENTFYITSMKVKRTCYDSHYPLGVLSRHSLSLLTFDAITILYGGNGSGKSTALNVIAQKLHLGRGTLFNSSAFMEDYLAMCDAEHTQIAPQSMIITSDDVFDHMLNLRQLNEGIAVRREELFDEYLRQRTVPQGEKPFQLRSMDDYEELKTINLARSKTQSRYVRARLMGDVREYSNGESAMQFFASRIRDGGLYLLDEPENSLSPEKQLELAQFIEESARFYQCQFVIATHSPFLLSLRGARVYDLDSDPACVRRWTELPAVRTYYEFFRQHEKAFE